MKFFAYGSNISFPCIRARIPTVEQVGVYRLTEHDLRFHMPGRDGSGKCDAFFTGHQDHYILGIVYDIDEDSKVILDQIEGLGSNYLEKDIHLESLSGEPLTARTYYAQQVNQRLKPYYWYRYHILVGARESTMPKEYIHRLEQVDCIADPDRQREQEQRSVYQK